MIRRLVAAVGTLLAAGVALVVLDPSIAAAIPVETVVAVLGNDYFFVAVFAALALGLAVVALGGRAVSGLDQTTPPRPETVQEAPLFGSDFDETVSRGVGLWLFRNADRKASVRERLRESAVHAEIRAGRHGRSAAEQAVADGTWTTDPEAAAFLDESAAPPLEGRLRAALHGETWFQRGARRTAEIVVEESPRGEHQ